MMTATPPIDRRDTNTTTHFMREVRALQAICDLVVVPNLQAGRDTVVWCVGSSTGDEPYGLAMLCREAGASPTILATDINPDALDRARRGRYPVRNLRHVDDARRDRWFRRDGSHWQLVPEIRDAVRFRDHDITREACPRHDVDVVICRNVMVHFAPDEVRKAVTTMVAALRPGALLVLGAAEWLRNELRDKLVPLELGGAIVYQRVDTLPRQMPVGSGTHVLRRDTPSLGVPAAPRITPSSGVPAPVGDHVSSGVPTLINDRTSGSLRFLDLADEVTALRGEGDELLDRGNALQARTLYERALERAPLLGDLHLRVALTHLHLGEAEAARDRLRRALFLTPKLWAAWVLMADLAHDPSHARHCLERARLALA